jgi:hypothetical protein
MKDKLIEYIVTHFKGLSPFRKEYEQISDRLLVEDAKMLLHLFPSKELEELLNEFIGEMK